MDEIQNSNGFQGASLAPRTTALPDSRVLDIGPEKVPSLFDYWQIILKHRWLLISTLLIVFSIVAVGTLKQKPSFQGSILVEIDPDPPSVVNFKEILQVASADVESYRETQYRVLESRSLAESVVKDLELYRLPEFYRSRRLFGLFESDPARIPSPTEDLDPSSEAFNNSIANFMNSMSVGPVRRSNLVERSEEHTSELQSR